MKREEEQRGKRELKPRILSRISQLVFLSLTFKWLLLPPQILLRKLIMGMGDICVSQAPLPAASNGFPCCYLPRNVPDSLLSHNPHFSWLFSGGALGSFLKTRQNLILYLRISLLRDMFHWRWGRSFQVAPQPNVKQLGIKVDTAISFLIAS